VPLEWEPALSVGVPEIDVQHRQILHRLRRLHAALAEGRERDVKSAVRFLERYVAEHFATEEAWMEEFGYPGEARHLAEHAEFLDKLAAARVAGSAHSHEHVFFVRRWLEVHVVEHDVKLARFLGARERLKALAGAGR
jgi:hemerythrin-like metal-binding protein